MDPLVKPVSKEASSTLIPTHAGVLPASTCLPSTKHVKPVLLTATSATMQKPANSASSHSQ